ncbi:hypothetical protein JHK82_013060 [Glycine max]|uniref:Uncharacterized protein n=2 Tax=Glycine subgen. Soja TaxID=1462606 RepID=A0A0R0K5Y1_SOYBN|nr:hypothetical protein JHK87_012980 [Glycine soja]KAG5040950.1 hypothetical protein JHK85_013426 [Glycine max]KAG5058090.1 hypothetical protein JHK86_013086 [Glycine max]KAG5155091.1 hypothetical protein JHK82_013060 [Glycine max]KAH1134587.1 hypothetical protein GYH30_012771 [Glycine max]
MQEQVFLAPSSCSIYLQGQFWKLVAGHNLISSSSISPVYYAFEAKHQPKSPPDSCPKTTLNRSNSFQCTVQQPNQVQGSESESEVSDVGVQGGRV